MCRHPLAPAARHFFFRDPARPDAEAMIIAARVKAGWITEEEEPGDAEGEGGGAEASDESAEAPAEATPADKSADA